MADGVLYWLKLKRDFFKRHDIRIVESMPNGKDYVLFYLKLLCESLDHEGNLRFSDTIPYSDEMLSALTSTNIDIVRSAVKVFVELHMMELMDDGTLFMTELHKMAGKQADNANANRQRRFRENHKADGVTQALPERYGGVTKNNESLESRDKSLESRESTSIDTSVSISVDSDFDVFWNAYPKKVAKQTAKKSFSRIPKKDIPGLMSALEQHKRSRQWTEDGGRYIPNPSTWLNQRRWEDDLGVQGRTDSGNPFLDIAEELEARERDGF